jgi:hypothetical protein
LAAISHLVDEFLYVFFGRSCSQQKLRVLFEAESPMPFDPTSARLSQLFQIPHAPHMFFERAVCFLGSTAGVNRCAPPWPEMASGFVFINPGLHTGKFAT